MQVDDPPGFRAFFLSLLQCSLVHAADYEVSAIV